MRQEDLEALESVGLHPIVLNDPEDFTLLWDLMPACEVCGCDGQHACPGGCAWSERYLDQDRAVCTNCESIMIMLEINMAAMRIMLKGTYAIPQNSI